MTQHILQVAAQPDSSWLPANRPQDVMLMLHRPDSAGISMHVLLLTCAMQGPCPLTWKYSSRSLEGMVPPEKK